MGSQELGFCFDFGCAGLSPALSCDSTDRPRTDYIPATADAPTILCSPDGRESAKSRTVYGSCRAWSGTAVLVATGVDRAHLSGNVPHADLRLESLWQSDRKRDRTGNPRFRTDLEGMGKLRRWKLCAYRGFLHTEPLCKISYWRQTRRHQSVPVRTTLLVA